MARVLNESYSFTCTPRVHSLMEWTAPAFAFPAEAGTHLPTQDGWTAELALGGWLVTYRNKCPALGIEHRHGRPFQYCRGPTLINFVDRSQRANHYARPPTTTFYPWLWLPFQLSWCYPAQLWRIYDFGALYKCPSLTTNFKMVFSPTSTMTDVFLQSVQGFHSVGRGGSKFKKW